MKSKNRSLRALLSQKSILMVPGAHDPLSARLAEKCGFQAVYMSGSATVNSQLGMPDHSIATLTEMVRNASNICDCINIPLISDADTGYGGVLNVIRTVKNFEKAGVSAIHLEDQVLPKKCGHVDEKEVVPLLEMEAKIKAACLARRDPDFMIIARTDAKAPLGYDESVIRGRAYMAAGADMIFPEALETKEAFEAYAKDVKAPLMANMTEFGKTPYLSAEEFQKLGYQMVIYPVSSLRVALKAIDNLYKEILETGTQKNMLDRMYTRKELYELTEYNEMLALEKKLTDL